MALVGTTLFAAAAHAQQQAPAGRTNLDPASRNKTSMAIARSRLDSGGSSMVEKTKTTGLGNQSTCATNIGTSTNTPATGDRYGPGRSKDQIIVVRGPVINVCK